MSTKLSMRQVLQSQEVYDEEIVNIDQIAQIILPLGICLSLNDIEEITQDCSTTENGGFDATEILSLMIKYVHRHEKEREELMKVFKTFDSNEDGFITAGELKYVLNSLGEKVSEKEVRDMIKEIDMKGEGRVSYQDFVRMMKRSF